MANSKSSTRDLAVGLTVLAGLVGISVLMLVFGYTPELTRDDYPITIKMDTTGELNPSSMVKLSGIPVGRVTEIDFAPGGPADGVVITASIEAAYQIPEGSRVRVATSIFGGSAVANITPPKRDAPDAAVAYLPTDGSARLDGRVAGLLAELEGPLASLETLTADITALSAEWTTVGQNLNELLEGRSVASVDAGDAVANVATLVRRLDARVAEAEALIAAATELVGDPDIRRDLKTTLSNAADVSAAAGEFVADARTSLNDLGEQAKASLDDLSLVLTRSRDLIGLLSEGEGTVAKLINDPALINNLNDAAERLQVLLDKARLLIEKWQAEGVPIYF